MSKFRRIPVEPVEVEGFKINYTSPDEPPAWVCEAFERGALTVVLNRIILNPGPNFVEVGDGDWLLRFPDGHLEALAGDVFARLYEPA